MSTATDTPSTARHRDADYTGPALGKGGHGHPSDLQYIGIALFLGIITAVEVALSYVLDAGGTQTIMMLALAVIKFAMVALYFMHLKFDSRNFRRLFVTGIILALFCYIVVLTTFQFWNR